MSLSDSPVQGSAAELLRCATNEWLLSPTTIFEEGLMLCRSTVSPVPWGFPPPYPGPGPNPGVAAVRSGVLLMNFNQIVQPVYNYFDQYTSNNGAVDQGGFLNGFGDGAMNGTPFWAAFSDTLSQISGCSWPNTGARASILLSDPSGGGNPGSQFWRNIAVAIRSAYKPTVTNTKAWSVTLSFHMPFTFDPTTGIGDYGNMVWDSAAFNGYQTVIAGVGAEVPMIAAPSSGFTAFPGGVATVLYWEPALTPQIWEAETGITLTGL